MRYGLEVPNGGECGAPTVLAELATLAEEAGWDGIFLEDYICYYGGPAVPTYDPWVTLAAMALRTTHIRLGTTVTALARRRPWKRARELVTLDHLFRWAPWTTFSGGWADDPDTHRRAELLDESLAILDGLWRGEPFSYRGKHHVLEEITFLPRPVQTPRIPIWIGGSAQRKGPVRRAARWDGVLPLPVPTDNGGRHLTATEVQRTERGPFDVALGGLERGPDWEEERAHIASVAEAGATWWMEGIPAANSASMRAAIERGPLRID
jgi:alkanesulfonate monooxygenase SsuD/methylene tetrahydromethanopterin reductase-like flavin-dependent oxidoreductase (luciferase family)